MNLVKSVESSDQMVGLGYFVCAIVFFFKDFLTAIGFNSGSLERLLRLLLQGRGKQKAQRTNPHG